MSNLPAAQNAPARQVDPLSLPPVQLGIQDSHGFSLAQRVATLFANSSLVPTQYQGNMPNCFIALNMATRLKADPMMVIQNLYIVHGRPSWSAQFMIALFNQSDRFDTLRYKPVGEKGKDSQGYIAYATDLKMGEVLEGPEITVGLAKANGWWSKIDKYGKESSKWPVMTDMMLRYRAASWFIRAYAPEMAMGIQTAEEVRDTYDLESDGDTFTLPPKGQTSADLNAMLHPFQSQVEPVDLPPATSPATAPQAAQPEQPAQAQTQAEPPQGMEPPVTAEDGKSTRRTKEEMDGLRVDLVEEIAAEGLDLKAVEHAVRGFSNQWSMAQMDKIRNVLIPNMKAEKAGLV